MRPTLKSLRLSLLCAVACGCGSSEGEGSGVEGWGTAGQGGGGTGSSVGGLSVGGGSGSGGKSTSGGNGTNGGSPTNGGSGGGDANGGGGSGGVGSMELSSAEQMMLFGQAPHCTLDFDYQLEGSIDGGMVHDIRDAGFTGGYTNGNNGDFETPSANSADQPTRVKISFRWTQGLSHGEASTIVQGIVVPPLGNPRAGEELCITQGAVGFVMGGADDGNFKFWLHEARTGADCSGEVVPIDLRGCM